MKPMQTASLFRPAPLPVERILFDGENTRVGTFRCAVSDPLFENSGPIVNPIFVFPRSCVAIRHDGGVPFVADPTIATLYNRGQTYTRAQLSPDGDHCVWFAVAPKVLAHILRAAGRSAAARAEQPFTGLLAPVDDATYLLQRRILARLERSSSDPRGVERAVIALAARLLGTHAKRVQGPRAGGAAAVPQCRNARVERAREVLALSFREPLPLREIADRVGISAFHLSRVFKRQTGLTPHRYLTVLRLRYTLERLDETGAGLTALALEAGFSSHSHFTAAFRRAFGLTPSALWRSLSSTARRRPFATSCRRS